jgi:hypothetical protein
MPPCAAKLHALPLTVGMLAALQAAPPALRAPAQEQANDGADIAEN